MRKMICILTLACAPVALHAQSVLRDTTINVSSLSSARIVADRVWMYVSIEGAGETPALAVPLAARFPPVSAPSP